MQITITKKWQLFWVCVLRYNYCQLVWTPHLISLGQSNWTKRETDCLAPRVWLVCWYWSVSQLFCLFWPPVCLVYSAICPSASLSVCPSVLSSVCLDQSAHRSIRPTACLVFIKVTGLLSGQTRPDTSVVTMLGICSHILVNAPF